MVSCCGECERRRMGVKEGGEGGERVKKEGKEGDRVEGREREGRGQGEGNN